MKRREFITLVGCGAVAWPLTARSQQSGRFRRIGVLAGSAESAEVRSRTAAFLLTLQNLGWRVDDNIQIDVRWLGSDPGRIQTNRLPAASKRGPSRGEDYGASGPGQTWALSYTEARGVSEDRECRRSGNMTTAVLPAAGFVRSDAGRRVPTRHRCQPT
jgi:hypothetical protein